MKKGYYWIPPTDFTWNAMEFYQASLKGDIKFDFENNQIYFELNLYFPVGSIFHFTGDNNEYVITAREKKPGLHYIAERTDGCPVTRTDIEIFESGRWVRRTGYAYDR